MKNNKLICRICGIAALSLFVAGCGNDDLIATVGDKDVLQPEFQAHLQSRNIPLDDASRKQRELDQYLRREALAQAIEKTEEVEQKKLQAEVKAFYRQALLSRYFEKVLADKVDEQSISNYYKTNIKDFQKEQYKVAHILIATPPSASDIQVKIAQTKSHEIYSKLMSGEKFELLAKQFSQDKSSAKKLGLLGWVSRGAISKEFSDVVSKLEVGKHSEPVQTSYGFHIIKLLEPKRLNTQPLTLVGGDIRYLLRNKLREGEVSRLLQSVEIKKVQ